MENVNIDFNRGNLSWSIPCFRYSSTISLYQVIGINETGGVVLNKTVNSTYIALDNAMICLIHNIIIVAIDGGYNSTVTEEVIYPDG